MNECGAAASQMESPEHGWRTAARAPLAAAGDEPGIADLAALRAAHLRIAWGGFIASVMTTAAGFALFLLQ
jgi:hypothetical protein